MNLLLQSCFLSVVYAYDMHRHYMVKWPVKYPVFRKMSDAINLF